MSNHCFCYYERASHVAAAQAGRCPSTASEDSTVALPQAKPLVYRWFCLWSTAARHPRTDPCVCCGYPAAPCVAVPLASPSLTQSPKRRLGCQPRITRTAAQCSMEWSMSVQPRGARWYPWRLPPAACFMHVVASYCATRLPRLRPRLQKNVSGRTSFVAAPQACCCPFASEDGAVASPQAALVFSWILLWQPGIHKLTHFITAAPCMHLTCAAGQQLLFRGRRQDGGAAGRPSG